MAATDGGSAVRAPPSFVSGAASAWAAPNASPALSKAAAERWESAFTMSLRCHTPIFRRSLKILQNFHKMQEISGVARYSLTLLFNHNWISLSTRSKGISKRDSRRSTLSFSPSGRQPLFAEATTEYGCFLGPVAPAQQKRQENRWVQKRPKRTQVEPGSQDIVSNLIQKEGKRKAFLFFDSCSIN